MDSVASLLPSVLRKRGLMGQASAALVTHHAKAWLALHLEGMTDFLHVASLKDGELLIYSTHSIAAQECQQHADQLLRHLREECGHADVERIRMSRERV